MMRGSRIGAGLIAFLACLALSAQAGAAPRIAGTFDVSGQPGQLALGPDGNVWVALDNGNVARVLPNGTVTEFAVAAPAGIVAGPDGNLWVTRNGGVASFSPEDPEGTVEAFNIPDIASPQSITRGPGGNLWTASGDKLFKIPPAAPLDFEDFTIPDLAARGIAASRGNLFIADFFGVSEGRIVRVTPTGTPTFFPVGGNGPQQVAAGPNGQVAYTNQGTVPQTVGRITPKGQVRKTNTPETDPFGIALGTDGAYWVAEFLTNRVGRLTPAGKYRNPGKLGLPAGAGARHLARGARNTLWVSLETAQKIARIRGVDPQTKITKGPKGTVQAKGSKTKVRFKFRSPGVSGLKFRCALKGPGKKAKFRRCKSAKKYRLRPGGYRFSVRAQGIGRPDPSPAKRKFRIVR